MSIPQVDWGISGRVDGYECYLVDPFTLTETDKVEFDAEGSSITYAYDTDTQYSATIVVLDDLAKDSMLRIKHTVKIAGSTFGETMGTFFVKSTSMSTKHGRVQRSMDCYSPLLRQSDDTLIRVHDYYPGDNVSGIIQEIVEADGGRMAFGPDAPIDRTHTMDIHWDIGTNKLDLITTEASWISGEISVTGDGYIQLDRYTAPSDRPVQWTFEAGANCIYLPGLDTSEDEGDVYNRAHFWYSTNDATDYAYADLAPTEPYSYERIGRHVTYSEKLTDATTHEDLQTKATGYLQEHGGGAIYYEIEHAGVPGLKPGMMVRYINDTDYTSRIDRYCLVTEMSINSLAPMCRTKTKMRVVM